MARAFGDDYYVMGEDGGDMEREGEAEKPVFSDDDDGEFDNFV